MGVVFYSCGCTMSNSEVLSFIKNLDWENYMDDPQLSDLVVKLKDHIGSGGDDYDYQLKLLVVGDGAVGKTCALVTYATNEFPEEYVPTVFDNRSIETTYEGKSVLLQLWDTAGQEDYDRLRPLSYPGSDIILLCYSTVNQASFEAITEKWQPEVEHYADDVPLLLVGTKLDMREGKIADPHADGFEPISTEEGKELQEEIGAQGFVECSAKTRENLKELFETALKIAIKNKKN